MLELFHAPRATLKLKGSKYQISDAESLSSVHGNWRFSATFVVAWLALPDKEARIWRVSESAEAFMSRSRSAAI